MSDVERYWIRSTLDEVDEGTGTCVVLASDYERLRARCRWLEEGKELMEAHYTKVCMNTLYTKTLIPLRDEIFKWLENEPKPMGETQ